ncbi:MAG: DNA polymerase III subunit gamma/tau [Alphaproteobacteria bacterium]|nr:DNA polymerase III subunit gamma/tau [Alphaproteobacteria bacterium]
MSEQENQYVVLARKYRPQVFEDLLGQDALVQTLKNAIENNRLHHAYILTGIRGVGKTTTARLIARALNCTGLDGKSGPTIHPCGQCENCKAIASGRHIDVLELDAASRTGVDDIRELLAGVQYKPTNARYKIYIIDEVHMLSKGAFNALLKTLEEPPAHVKFIFATTEIRKVPVTILSRCQRFDLERLSIDTLLELFHKVLKAEGIEADEEALQVVAKAADGSARDGLSMLDQAIVLGSGKIRFETVKEMIGLADRTQMLALFESLVKGDLPKVLENVNAQYQHGANPQIILKDLIEIVHMIAKSRIVPNTLKSALMGENERILSEKLSKEVPIAVLSKMWQMMIKGLSEINNAPLQSQALEMVLIRIAYSAQLPTPSEILEELKKKPLGHDEPQTLKKVIMPENKPVALQTQISVAPNNGSIQTIQDLISYLEKSKKLLLLYALKNDVCVTHFQSGKMSLVLSEKVASDFVSNLKQSLKEATGGDWGIDVQYGQVSETIADREKSALENDKRQISEYPLVKAILAEFKGAKFDTVIHAAQNEASENDDDLTTNLEEEYE